MRFYVLKCKTNKFILGEDWLRRMKVDPIEQLEERCSKKSKMNIINEINKVEKENKLIEWKNYINQRLKNSSAEKV
eukprot:snap_masked-scaffold_26-processed-gene-4.81-mRNA-1 protein AED:1.00 eAED:1.00 QI:0/-1/0/0/-1/1/1/0/75